MKYLIVGLGNIGAEYDMTRHNIGFRVADAIAARLGVRFETKRYGDVAMGRAKSAQIVLLKPSTYMNLSGEAVRYWMSTEKIPIERVLVIVDDLALPFGALRLKGKGSDAGHNGHRCRAGPGERAEEYRPAPRLAVLCPSALRYRE